MNIVNYLKALYYFEVVARHSSVTLAAEELCVTRAAVSQQVKLLESALKITLFHRHHQSLSLTVEGERLYPHIQKSFREMSAGVAELSNDDTKNTLRLSVLPSFASQWLIPKLNLFYQQHPDISINLELTDNLEVFTDHHIDLAIRFGNGKYENMQSQYVMKDSVYPVCHPDYLKNGLSIKNLSEARFFEDVSSHNTWDFWGQTDTNQDVMKNISPKNLVQYDGSHYVVDSALRAQGIAMTRHSLVAESIAQGQLIRPFPDYTDSNLRYFVCAPKENFSLSKVDKFVTWLHHEANNFLEKYPL